MTAGHDPRAAGFTLLELLLAMTLTATIVVAALGALGMFAEADARLIQASEIEVDVTRALRLLRADVHQASAIDVQARQWTITRLDGRTVVYVVPANGTELHRLVGSGLAELLLPVQTLLVASLPAAEYSPRGHLRDGSYRAAAVLQGLRGITGTAIVSPVDGAPIGLGVRIGHEALNGPRTSSGAAVSLALCEAHRRP